MLTLGTGVGGAYSLHGRPVRGKRWYGGEWGHSILVPGGMPCNCGKKGCAEQYISGTALHRRGRESVDKIYPSAHDLIKGAEAGEEEALRVLEEFVSDLAVVIVNIGITLDPDAVIVGGDSSTPAMSGGLCWSGKWVNGMLHWRFAELHLATERVTLVQQI